MNQDMIEVLRQVADEQQLIQEAHNGYKTWIQNYPESLPSHVNPEKVQGVFKYHKLCFKSALVSYPYIETYLELEVDNQSIGHYRLISMLDGRIEDDYYIIDE